jgi:membrane fusion protein (multidrug efflux system)
MNKITKIILFSVIILFILGMVLYPIIKSSSNKEKTPAGTTEPPNAGGRSRGMPLNVNVKIIQPETLIDYIRSSGTVFPDEEVDLTFETSGKITNLFFKEGTQVTKGELLAKVNDKPLLAELQKLEAQIPLAEDRVFRQKSLLEKDAVSKEAYEQVTTELEKLHADIALAKARIAQTELRAPFDGIIGLRAVSEGAYASPTTLIAHLTKIIPLKIEFSVNEQYANDVVPGTGLTFKTDKGVREYNASVYAVESRVDLTTRTLKARAMFPNSDGKLKPGSSAYVEIKSNVIRNALAVPSEVVVKEVGKDIAYIYSMGKAKRVELTGGLRTASNIQVLRGLNKGDTLIVSGVMQLRDGLPVTIDNILQ